LKYFLRIRNVGNRINPSLVSLLSGLPVAHYAGSDSPQPPQQDSLADEVAQVAAGSLATQP